MVRQACWGVLLAAAAWAGPAQAINYDGSGTASTWFRNHEGPRVSISYCNGQDCVVENTTYAGASIDASMSPGSIRVNLAASGWGDGWGEVGYMGTFNDKITLTSSTLPAGTPVQLRYSVLFDVATSGGAGGAPVFTVSLGQFADCCNAVFNQWNATTTAPAALTQGVLVWGVGQTVDLTGRLAVGTGQAHRVPGLATAEGTVRYFVDAMDPQVQIVSASGYDYRMAAPVPEPAAWATLVAGLALLGRQLRRRTR